MALPSTSEAPRPSTSQTPPTPTATSTATSTATATATATSDAPPRTYAEASARLAAAGTPQTVRAFRTPSGNIYCHLSGPGAQLGCELTEGRITPPAGLCDTGGGGAHDVGRIEFDHGKPAAVCNSDTIVTEEAPASLPYGSVAGGGHKGIRCLSEQIGVTCVDDASHRGFFLARGMYLLF